MNTPFQKISIDDVKINESYLVKHIPSEGKWYQVKITRFTIDGLPWQESDFNAGILTDDHEIRIMPPKPKTYTDENMYLNMQYYYEYCLTNPYITPQDWIKNHKHF